MFPQFWQVIFIVFTMIIATKIVGDQATAQYMGAVAEQEAVSLLIAFND